MTLLSESLEQKILIGTKSIKEMVVSIHQPSYWPWLGLLDKIAKTDTFILLDDAQVSKGTFQYRNIFYCNGKATFITLPVNLRLGTRFNELEFKNDKWKVVHLNKLHSYYLKAPYFIEVYSWLEKFYSNTHNEPIELLKETMLFTLEKLDIKIDFFLSSKLKVSGQKGEMVLNLCKAIGATHYLAGRGSFKYMQDYLPGFKEAKIKVIWHEFNHPVYMQDPRFPFVDGLSCLDFFFFLGFKKAKEIFQESIKIKNVYDKE
jgi:hypothetical protein